VRSFVSDGHTEVSIPTRTLVCWGSELRAPGASWALALTGQPHIRSWAAASALLFCLFIGLVAGCGAASVGGPGGAAVTAGSSAVPEAPPTRPPGDHSVPGVVPGATGPLDGPVDTPEEALAAVIARFPEYAGYQLPELVPRSSGGFTDAIGAPDRLVLASRTVDGFRLQFTTGSGDCASGCTASRVEIFLVDSHGLVEGPLKTGGETGV
jgi:hypothetical protein